MSIDLEMTESGPLFDGQVKRTVDGFIDAAESEVGRQGVNDVQARLGAVLQNPTGRYERSIVTDRQFNDLAVTDSGIVYGPWLEGVSSRNTRTRFKGYATFRRVTQQLGGKTAEIAGRVLPSWLGRLR